MKTARAKKNPHRGSTFEAYLAEQEVLEETTARAIKRVLAWEIDQAMKKRRLTKSAMAARMKTSRSQLDRLLDPANDAVSLESLVRAASAVGKRLRIGLEDAA
jgi:antitoxin HicB